MASLFAPRPLLITSGELDPNNPVGGAKLAHEAARAAYKSAGAADKVKILLALGVGHQVPPEHRTEITDWLVKWLGPVEAARTVKRQVAAGAAEQEKAQ